MNIRILTIVALLIPLGASAQTLGDLRGLASPDNLSKASEAMGGSASDLLQSQLDVDKDQADGGIGAMLALAGEKLSAGEYDKLASNIPGASKYLEKAKSLGAMMGPLKDMGGLNSALGKLGISPETVANFVPTATDYLGKLGGEDTKKLLEKAFGSG